MDIEKIERRLRKINTVLDIFKEDNKISTIEKDLLLGYVRELYDIIKEDGGVAPAPTPKVEHVMDQPITPQPIVPAIENKPIDPKSIEIKLEKTPIKEHTPVPTPEPTPATPPKEEAITSPEPKVEAIKIVEEPPVVTPPAQNNNEAKTVVNNSSTNTEAIEILFKVEEINDISDKLSMTKIDDISKVIGINERLYLIHELFGGNGELFSNTVNKLNAATSFEAAKELIIADLFYPLQWEKDDRVKKAAQFIKHVRRRFS
jgi:hypothetical protein